MKKYIYNYNYRECEESLVTLEQKYLFNSTGQIRTTLFSNFKFKPDISWFIKGRLEIIVSKPTFIELVSSVKEKKLITEEFNILLISEKGIKNSKMNGKKKAKELGMIIDGECNFINPINIFGFMIIDNKWYFGRYEANDMKWKKYSKKPYSYSSSLPQNISKTLVNIASCGNKNIKLIDPCCGVGTVLLDANYNGYNIEGVEINESVALSATKNLKFYKVNINVINDDLKNVSKKYDVAIIDLPYDNFCHITEENLNDLISNIKLFASKFVFISGKCIDGILKFHNYKITETCGVSKNDNNKIKRIITICE